MKLSRFKSSAAKPKIVGKTRSYSYGENWNSFSLAIKKERGRMCQKCGTAKNLQDHHIVPLSRGGSNSRANLRVLCKTCHDLFH